MWNIGAMVHEALSGISQHLVTGTRQMYAEDQEVKEKNQI